MKEKGLSVTWLTNRLIAIPAEFITKPENGILSINTIAVVSDLLFDLGGNFLEYDKIPLLQLDEAVDPINVQRIILIACYLYHDPWFIKKEKYAEKVFAFLCSKPNDLSEVVNAESFVFDSDRREELARICLDALDLIPEGESENYAMDRLTALDSIERANVIEKTRKTRERARLLREAMARKAAEEAASKMSRE
jgi:hypothetical protein